MWILVLCKESVPCEKRPMWKRVLCEERILCEKSVLMWRRCPIWRTCSMWRTCPMWKSVPHEKECRMWKHMSCDRLLWKTHSFWKEQKKKSFIIFATWKKKVTNGLCEKHSWWKTRSSLENHEEIHHEECMILQNVSLMKNDFWNQVWRLNKRLLCKKDVLKNTCTQRKVCLWHWHAFEKKLFFFLICVLWKTRFCERRVLWENRMCC